jgi:hypothetical protein
LLVAIGTRVAATLAAGLCTVPLAACGGSDDSPLRATLTDDGCTYEGDNTVAAGRFTIEVEDRTGHGGHFVLKAIATAFTSDTIKPIVDNPGPAGPEIASLFKDEPVFSSDVHSDTSAILLADAPAGSYVLMCHALDRWRTQGPYYAAQIEVT